jgi:hypothetical protein
MSELSAVLINADSRFTNFDFSREFEAKVGVKVGGTFEYISLGVFKGNRPDKVRGKLIDFTAHDRMSLFDKSAESFVNGLTFPCTLGEIFAKLCAFCGVGYVSAVFPNSGKTFDKNPLADTDYTCREILGYIAEAAGAYARMSRDGAAELVWFADVNYTVTRTDRFEMTESEFLTPPIDRLEVYNSYGDQLNSSGSGDIVYGISDNPFLYIENDTQLTGLQAYVDAIYDRITSLPAYHPSSFRAEFNPAVQCGDIISVVDDYGETIRFPVFVQTITWNGFGKTTYENTGGVIRQNAPFTQRELEQIKKKSLRAVDLYTTIDSYMSTDEGVASITSAVGGKFVTQDALSGYAKTTEVSSKIIQEVNNGIASLTLSVTNGTKTSTIKLLKDGVSISSQTIQFNGEVVFKSDLSTPGSTTIDGANIKTGKISADRIDTSTLYAKQVLLNTDKGDYPMISSELSDTNNTAYVKIGVTTDNGWAQFVDVYGTYIRFGRPGYNISTDTNGFSIDMTNQRIIPDTKNEWSIGWNNRELFSFWARRHGFYDNTYLRVTEGQLRFYYPVGRDANDDFGYDYDYVVLAEYDDNY